MIETETSNDVDVGALKIWPIHWVHRLQCRYHSLHKSTLMTIVWHIMAQNIQEFEPETQDTKSRSLSEALRQYTNCEWTLSSRPEFEIDKTVGQ
ncbi:hypothetical protein BLOT_006978 [Blomia tropicalis]|nr:hypothetical protein BLOT_006978 [Blomia tropicalis]